MAEPPCLTGHFAPTPEEHSAFELTVHGRLPFDLNGRYFRNGPPEGRPAHR